MYNVIKYKAELNWGFFFNCGSFNLLYVSIKILQY